MQEANKVCSFVSEIYSSIQSEYVKINEETDFLLFRTKNVFQLNINKFIPFKTNEKILIKNVFDTNTSANKHLLCG